METASISFTKEVNIHVKCITESLNCLSKTIKDTENCCLNSTDYKEIIYTTFISFLGEMDTCKTPEEICDWLQNASIAESILNEFNNCILYSVHSDIDLLLAIFKVYGISKDTTNCYNAAKYSNFTVVHTISVICIVVGALITYVSFRMFGKFNDIFLIGPLIITFAVVLLIAQRFDFSTIKDNCRDPDVIRKLKYVQNGKCFQSQSNKHSHDKKCGIESKQEKISKPLKEIEFDIPYSELQSILDQIENKLSNGFGFRSVSVERYRNTYLAEITKNCKIPGLPDKTIAGYKEVLKLLLNDMYNAELENAITESNTTLTMLQTLSEVDGLKKDLIQDFCENSKEDATNEKNS